MPQAKRKPAAKKKAAKRKPAARRPSEPKIQTNRTPEERPPVTETPTQDPPLFKGTKDELDENGETQADRDAAGTTRQAKVRGSQRDPVVDYESPRQPLEHENFDHEAAEEDRQAELQDERDEHNERTGDASLGQKGTWS